MGEQPARSLPALCSGAAACEDFSDIIDNFMIFDFIKISDSKVRDSKFGANGNFVSVSSKTCS